ncbi:unnamed protein product, partial [Sympodiomycopsis kandeliae]
IRMTSRRELIQVSFGSLPGHLSAHYFNTQTGYFNYSPSAPEPLVDHDITWQEGADGRGQERFTPRWLAYDVRDGFTGLRRDEAYEGEAEDEAYRNDNDQGDEKGTPVGPHASSWATPAEVVKTQQRLPSTPFRNLTDRERKGEDVDWDAEIEKEFASDDEDDADHDENVLPPGGQRSSQPRPKRPWSGRLLFELHPKTIVPVTANGGLPLYSMDATSTPEGVEIFESFEQGWARAKDWERDHETMDTSLRFLLEAADQPQGFNILQQSTDAWSGFAHWNLEQMVDEYPKLDKLVWSLRWGSGLGDLSSDSLEDEAQLRTARIRSMNEALSLVMAGETASLFTPLNLPKWSAEEGDSKPQWANHLRSDIRSKLYDDEAYWTSLLASHFETATLGMRLRTSPITASALTSQLNWRGDTHIAQLGGCLPIPLLAPMEAPLDPIEALLASRGYNPRPGQLRSEERGAGGRFDPAEIGRAGAKEIAKSWTTLSAASSSVVRPRKRTSSKTESSSAKPFAMRTIARDAQAGAQAITESSTQEWMAGAKEDGGLGLEEPWGRSLFTPLDQPILATNPAIYQDLTSNGRPWPRSSSSSASSSNRPKSLPLLSTLSTTPDSYTHIKNAMNTLSLALKSHTHLSSFGLVGPSSAPRNAGIGGGISSGQAANDEIEGIIGGRDGVKELLERIEEVRSAYEDGQDDHDGDENGRGTDEEWDDTQADAGEDDDLDWN